jgi:hypothetical protein
MIKNPHVTVKANTEKSCIPFTQFPTSVVKYYKVWDRSPRVDTGVECLHHPRTYHAAWDCTFPSSSILCLQFYNFKNVI